MNEIHNIPQIENQERSDIAEPLRIAMQSENVYHVLDVIKQAIPVTIEALYLAIELKNIVIMHCILDVNVKVTEKAFAMLIDSANGGDIPYKEYVLKRMAENIIQNKAITPTTFVLAIKSGNVEIISDFIEAGAIVTTEYMNQILNTSLTENQKPSKIVESLRIAIDSEKIYDVIKVIGNGIPVTIEALYLAIKTKDILIMHCILDANIKVTEKAFAMLIHLSESDDILGKEFVLKRMTKNIIQNKAVTRMTFALAIRSGNAQIVSDFIEAGANVTTECLYLALETKNEAVIARIQQRCNYQNDIKEHAIVLSQVYRHQQNSSSDFWRASSPIYSLPKDLLIIIASLMGEKKKYIKIDERDLSIARPFFGV